MDIEQIHAQMAQDRAFAKWRKRAIARMPEAASRVFTLRNKCYRGSGFHWAMERSLGNCLRWLSDYDDVSLYLEAESVANRVVLQILVSELFAKIVRAEKSLDKTPDED